MVLYKSRPQMSQENLLWWRQETPQEAAQADRVRYYPPNVQLSLLLPNHLGPDTPLSPASHKTELEYCGKQPFLELLDLVDTIYEVGDEALLVDVRLHAIAYSSANVSVCESLLLSHLWQHMAATSQVAHEDSRTQRTH